MIENSRAKLTKKRVDMIVANNVKTKGAGFGTDTNVVTLITKRDCEELPIMSKDEVAGKIFDKLLSLKTSESEDEVVNMSASTQAESETESEAEQVVTEESKE